jgi:hypothetical protein
VWEWRLGDRVQISSGYLPVALRGLIFEAKAESLVNAGRLVAHNVVGQLHTFTKTRTIAIFARLPAVA